MRFVLVESDSKYKDEAFTADDFDGFTKKQLDKMIDGADEYKGKDKKSALRAMKSARKKKESFNFYKSRR